MIKNEKNDLKRFHNLLEGLKHYKRKYSKIKPYQEFILKNQEFDLKNK